MVRTTQVLPLWISHGILFNLPDHYETTPPPVVIVPPPIILTIDDDGGLTWDDKDDISAVSLLAKFRMSNIEHYNGVGCLKIHLRLYYIVMRAHDLNDA
ncbi:hypothetical protein AAG906_002194 [Vitis piasezkii]